MKNDRFSINYVRICTFKNENNYIKPNYDYPNRLCVIDKQNNIVIDLDNNLKYDYIPTMNGRILLDNKYKNIKEEKRYAIFPVRCLSLSNEDLAKANKIINKLKNQKEFIDGNDVLNNEEFLKYSYKEKENLDFSENEKIKKLIK